MLLLGDKSDKIPTKRKHHNGPVRYSLIDTSNSFLYELSQALECFSFVPRQSREVCFNCSWVVF